jgi:hypothetical protein
LDRRLLRMQQEAERWMERRRRQMEDIALSARYVK